MKPYLIVGIFVLILVSLFNKKLNVLKIIKQQFIIYKNDKTKKKSCWDIFTFFINPLIISAMLVFVINYTFLINLSELVITVLSIVATILFSFLALLVDKKSKCDSEKAVQVSNETYVSIIMTIMYSLVALIFTACLLLLPEKIWLEQVYYCCS